MDIDKSTPQYQVILKYLNVILEKSNLPLISDLEQFQNVDKICILKPEIAETLLGGLANEIYKHFDKKKGGYYNAGPRWPINILNKTLQLLGGYKLTYIRKFVNVIINDETYKKPKQFYSIIRI